MQLRMRRRDSPHASARDILVPLAGGGSGSRRRAFAVQKPRPHRPDFLTTGRSANGILPVSLRPTLRKAKLSVLAIFVLPLELSVPFVSARFV